MHLRRFVLLLIAVSAWTGAALAQQPSASSVISRIVNLPLVNLVSSETAEVNVVNLAPSVMSVTPGALPAEGSLASCKGAITFYTSAGASIGSGTPFTIGTSQIFSASLPYSAIPQNDLVVSSTGRTPVRAVVTINWTVGTGPCSLASNIETYDTSTGVTNVHVEGGQAAFPEILQTLNPFGRVH
jgi:hypothetical protein